MTTLHVTIPDDLVTMIEAQALDLGFKTPGEYAQAILVRAVTKTERRLEELLLEGLRSPKSEMTQQDWADLSRRFQHPDDPDKPFG